MLRLRVANKAFAADRKKQHPLKSGVRLINKMQNPEIGKPMWFIKQGTNDSSQCLAFVRTNKGGAFIVGGPTGSHFTGHGESWQKKLKEINGKGFMTVAEAQKNGLIEIRWTPPNILFGDQELIDKIVAGII
jgi:hypothetical protein